MRWKNTHLKPFFNKIRHKNFNGNRYLALGKAFCAILSVCNQSMEFSKTFIYEKKLQMALKEWLFTMQFTAGHKESWYFQVL